MGRTYVFNSAMSHKAGYHYWLNGRIDIYAAVSPGGRVLGMFCLVPNRFKHGHMCPMPRIWSIRHRRGRRDQHQLASHWTVEKLGFLIVVTLTRAFCHKRLGYNDAYVMYQLLQDSDHWPIADNEHGEWRVLRMPLQASGSGYLAATI